MEVDSTHAVEPASGESEHYYSPDTDRSGCEKFLHGPGVVLGTAKQHQLQQFLGEGAAEHHLSRYASFSYRSSARGQKGLNWLLFYVYR